MKKSIALTLICFVFISFNLFAQRGMVTLYRQEDADTLLVSLIHLRYNLETELPIEIWFEGEDMTQDVLYYFS